MAAHKKPGETRAAAATWVAALLALLAAGPLVALILRASSTPTGLPDDTLLTAANPLVNAAALVVACILALALASAVRIPLSNRYAIFTAGLVFAWYAFNTGRLRTLAEDAAGDGLLVRFALEAALFAAIATALALVLARDRSHGHPEHLPTEPDLEPVRSTESVWAVAVALVAALAAAYLIAVTGLRGQTLAAGIAAGTLAGLAQRLFVQRAHPAAAVLGAALAGVVAPIVAMAILPADLLVAVRQESVFPPALLGPADWLAGALIGVPAGQYGALSLLDRGHEKADTARKLTGATRR